MGNEIEMKEKYGVEDDCAIKAEKRLKELKINV